MDVPQSSMTFRTSTSFGTATNDAVLAATGDFRWLCTNPNEYLRQTFSCAKFLELPNELLLNIFLSFEHVDRNRALRHLALTSRRFRHSTREVLMRTPVLHPPAAARYMKVLLQHPQCLKNITSLQFYAPEAYEWGSDDLVTAWESEEYPPICKQIVDHEATMDHRFEAVMRKWEPPSCFRGSWIWAAYFAALMVLLPNVRSVSFTETFFGRSEISSYLSRMSYDKMFTCEEWQVRVFRIVIPRIQELEVIDNTSLTSYSCVEFTQFSSLKHLTVSDELILYDGISHVMAWPVWAPPRNTELSMPSNILPLTLETLEVYVRAYERDHSEHEDVLTWIGDLLHHRLVYASLHHIRLQFKTTLSSFRREMANKSAELPPSLSNIRTYQKLFKDLTEAQITLSTFFLKVHQVPIYGLSAVAAALRYEILRSISVSRNPISPGASGRTTSN